MQFYYKLNKTKLQGKKNLLLSPPLKTELNQWVSWKLW